MPTVRAAWQRALFGPGGFYRDGSRGPGVDFRTPVTAGGALAGVVAELAARVDRELGYPDRLDVVDLGAGRGDLLAWLAEQAPRRWRLTGVEWRPRPPGLCERVRWRADLPRVRGLLLAVEWLDTVPCEVVDRGGVLLASGGRDETGLPAADRRWLQRWWPGWRTGRAEVGRYRDRAWDRACAQLERGLAVAVDYGHLRAGRRPTLAGWRAGRRVAACFDASTDVTAHVAVDSLAGRRLDQASAIRLLSGQGRAADPARSGGWPGRQAGEDPLAELAARSALAELTDPAGFGGYWWVVRHRGCPGAFPWGPSPSPSPSPSPRVAYPDPDRPVPLAGLER